MSKHIVKSKYGQCRCLFCGRPPQSDPNPCPVTLEMRREMLSWARGYGRMWKHELRTHSTLPKLISQALGFISAARLVRITDKILDESIRREKEQAPAEENANERAQDPGQGENTG